jgi:hypothetical protein
LTPKVKPSSISCLFTKTNNFYSANQVPTTLLTWEQTSNLKAINLKKRNIRPPIIYKEKFIKKKLNEEEVEIM